MLKNDPQSSASMALLHSISKQIHFSIYYLHKTRISRTKPFKTYKFKNRDKKKLNNNNEKEIKIKFVGTTRVAIYK